MLEPLTFAQASHCNHFDQINGGKINNWWKQRQRKYSQIYLDSTSIFYTFCFTFTFTCYFFEFLIQFTGRGEVWLLSNSITWDKFHHLGQIPSLGANTITWDKFHHLGQIPSLGANTITWNKFHHLEQIPSLGTNSITWEKFHHLGQIPSLGANSITWSKFHHLGQIPAFASNLSSNSQRPHIKLRITKYILYSRLSIKIPDQCSSLCLIEE